MVTTKTISADVETKVAPKADAAIHRIISANILIGFHKDFYKVVHGPEDPGSRRMDYEDRKMQPLPSMAKLISFSHVAKIEL